jgi:hypothetical protein
MYRGESKPWPRDLVVLPPPVEIKGKRVKAGSVKNCFIYIVHQDPDQLDINCY